MKTKNKKALVTGASRGIGLAIAEALAEDGYDLFITARDSRALEKVKSALSQKSVRIDFASSDLADVAGLEAMFRRATGFLGGIDVLINNAGIGIKSRLVDLSYDDWEKMLAVNLRAPFLLSRLAARLMISQKSGHIINIGSGASQTPIAEHAAYCATKHGLLGFSESLALELREFGIKVSIVLPGSTATHFSGSTPDKRVETHPGILLPQDIADSVLYLLNQRHEAWTSILNIRPLNLNRS